MSQTARKQDADRFSGRDQIQQVILANAQLQVVVAPAIGGRVVSLVDRASGREFLWRNPRLKLACCAPGSEYDPNFYGGIDELLPCDIPETIHGIACPDHGELWTLALAAEREGDALSLHGRLPRFGLDYRRRMRLDGNRLICDYRIANPAAAERCFMWKLHAALAVQPGDRIDCPAATARVADPAWSRRSSPAPFDWPLADGLDMARVPEPGGSAEFLYLYDLRDGVMALEARDGARIECRFDRAVFPCCWYFASHGARGGAYTAVLEPCTTMPLSVNEAVQGGFCSRLAAGEALETTVVWTVAAAGPPERTC
jgi:hypothetical protein